MPGGGTPVRAGRRGSAISNKTITVAATVDSKPVQLIKEEYKLVKKLGAGGFATVFLVANQRNGRFYAAKYQKTRDSEEKWAARTEVALLKKMEPCQFIINLQDFFEGPTESVIVTEFAEGTDLFATLSPAQYELTEGKCRVIMAQVVEALEYLHMHRVCHLDIKPNNILFSSLDHHSLKVRLIDFGLARELGGMDKVKCAMVGTLEFMAPEVMKCTFASPASDMWSLGVVLMMLVSGGLSPFWAGSDISTQRRIARCQYSLEDPAFKLVSSSSKDLIQKLLVLTPSKRLTAKLALTHSWLTPDSKTVEMGRVTRLETSRLRRHLARWRWMMIRRSLQALAGFKGASERKFSLTSEPDPDHLLEFLNKDNILLYPVKKAKLKKCFRRNSKTPIHKTKSDKSV